MARTWKCPDCGSGVLAPERPRRDDVRRYCLRCSERSGRLVARTCPALEKEREARAERAAARRSTVAQRASAQLLAARSHAGWDLYAEARRLWSLPIMREHHRGTRFPAIEFRHRERPYCSGHSSGWRIVVTLGLGSSLAEALSVLLHELAHSAAGVHHGHDETWAALYVGAARQRHGPSHFGRVPSGGGYATDRVVESGIAAAIAVGVTP